MENLELQKVANEVRKDIVTALHAAKAGHPGGSLSAADLFTYLYFEEMNIDPKDPKKADTSSSRILPSGTSGYEAYSWRRYVQRFPWTGNLCSGWNGTFCKIIK